MITNHFGSSQKIQMEEDSLEGLRRLLEDERRRAGEHRENYQRIKAELGKIQESHSRLENEFMNAMEIKQGEIDDCHRRLVDTNQRLVEAQNEVTALKVNQVTDKRIEAVRLKIEEQFEAVYQERFSVCVRECEGIRNECGRLRTENTFLTSEYDHQHKENIRIIEELNAMHEAEIHRLKDDKARLLISSLDISHETTNIKELSKDNSILKGHVKALSNELQEAISKLEHERSSCEQERRAKSKQLSESNCACRKLEIEIESIRKQLIESQKEISDGNSENSSLHFKNTELERTARALQSRLEELTQKARVDLTQLKLESTKQKGDIERQKELLSAKIEELEYQLQLAGTKCGQLETQLREREVTISRREAGIKETEWAKIQQLENEKMEFESQIADLQTSLREDRNSVSNKMDSLEERVRNAELKERAAEKESDAGKHKREALSNEIKNLKLNLNELKNKFVEREAELDECYNRLALSELIKKEKEELDKKIKVLEKKMKETETNSDNVWLDKEQQWLQDRERQRLRIKELEEEMAKSLERTRLLQEELRRKNKKHSKYFQDQNRRLQISSAKNAELQTENELLKRNVPSEEYHKLNKELKELRRRHQEYRSIILQPSTSLSLGPETSFQESRYEQSLLQLKRRLEHLDEIQQKQLPEILQMQLSDEKGDEEKESSRYGPEGDRL